MEKKTHGAITSVDMRNAEVMSDFVQDERSGMVTLEIYRKFYSPLLPTLLVVNIHLLNKRNLICDLITTWALCL